MHFLTKAGIYLAIGLVGAPAAYASCKGSICAESSETLGHGGALVLTWTITGPAQMTHFNVRDNGGPQVEMTTKPQPNGPVTIVQHPDFSERMRVSVQACNRASFGPFSSKSNCTPWANFSRTVSAEPKGSVTQGEGAGGSGLFLAVAGDEKGRFTASTGYPNKTGASAAAMNGCGAGCKILHENKAKCVSIAAVQEGKPWGITSASTLTEAQIGAQRSCAAQAPGRCHTVKAQCAGS